MPTKKSKSQIEITPVEFSSEDFVALLSLTDKPGRVVFISEKEEDGVKRRHLIEFPEDPLVLARLAECAMRIADIQKASINKKGLFNVQFGPKYARDVYKSTV